MDLYIKYSNFEICEYVLDKYKIYANLYQKDDIEDRFRTCEKFEYWVSIACVEKNVSILKWLMKKFPLKTYFHEYIIYGITMNSKFEEGIEISNKYVYRGVDCQGIWNKPYYSGWKSSYAKLRN